MCYCAHPMMLFPMQMFAMMYIVMGVYEMAVARSGSHRCMYLIQPINSVVALVFVGLFPPVASVVPAAVWVCVFCYVSADCLLRRAMLEAVAQQTLLVAAKLQILC